MDSGDILKLLRGHSRDDNGELADQLAGFLASSKFESGVNQRITTKKLGGYTNSDAAHLALALRQVLGYEIDEYPGDLADRLKDAFGIQQTTVSCDYVYGGTISTSSCSLIFLASDVDDREFQFALELGRLLISFSQDSRDWGSLTLRSWKNAPRRHYFARRFAYELLVTEPLLSRSLISVRAGLGVDSATIGDIEILALSRLFGISFYNTAKRLELVQLLPRGSAESLVGFLCEKFGSVERRASMLGFPSQKIEGH